MSYRLRQDFIIPPARDRRGPRCFASAALATQATVGATYVQAAGGDAVSQPNAYVETPLVSDLAASGDSINIAAATYTENLTIGKSLSLTGTAASTTVISGPGVFGKSVVTISSTTSVVTLSDLTITGGNTASGGGIYNAGVLTINNSTLTANAALSGGGIYNLGKVTINNSTLSNAAANNAGPPHGGGIYNGGTVTINNSTLDGNWATAIGGRFNQRVSQGGGIVNTTTGTVTISNSTISGNSAMQGSGIANIGVAALQNSIVAYNGCYNAAPVTSKGYNLGSDNSCNLNGPGDKRPADPKLGPLQYNGGPNQTMTRALPSGSPAIDAGNPKGCTDALGHLLTTDQRGLPRPDREDTAGCDMGAYESQGD